MLKKLLAFGMVAAVAYGGYRTVSPAGAGELFAGVFDSGFHHGSLEATKRWWLDKRAELADAALTGNFQRVAEVGQALERDLAEVERKPLTWDLQVVLITRDRIALLQFQQAEEGPLPFVPGCSVVLVPKGTRVQKACENPLGMLTIPLDGAPPGFARSLAAGDWIRVRADLVDLACVPSLAGCHLAVVVDDLRGDW